MIGGADIFVVLVLDLVVYGFGSRLRMALIVLLELTISGPSGKQSTNGVI